MTPHMSLPISTTTNCDLFKTPTLYNDNTYIAANGQTIMNTGADYIYYLNIINSMQTKFKER